MKQQEPQVRWSVCGSLVASAMSRAAFSTMMRKSINKETLCGSGCGANNLAQKGELESYGSLRARGGFAIDRVLLYLSAGGAYGEGSQKVESRCPGQFCSGDDLVTWNGTGSWWGVTAGAGAEYALTDRVSLNAEYLHTTFLSTVSSATCVFGSCPTNPTNGREKIWPELDSVRIGMSYKIRDFGL